MPSCALPPIQAHQDLVRSDWQLTHPPAASTKGSICERAERWNDAGFGNADDDFAFVFVINDRNHLGHFQRARQLVIAKSRIELHSKFRVNDAAFPESHPQRLNHAAVKLA